MTTITHKNREFKIIETSAIPENIAKVRPDADFWFIAEGKKGALVDGFVTKNGRVIVF